MNSQNTPTLDAPAPKAAAKPVARTRRITIEISELDAACLWANAWKQDTPERQLRMLAQADAHKYRQSFPSTVPGLEEQFRAKFPEPAPAPDLSATLEAVIIHHFGSTDGFADYLRRHGSNAFPCWHGAARALGIKGSEVAA